MAMQPSDYTEFPAEIVATPTPLIGLSGLDAVNNAVHRAVWDAFAADRREDRAPLRFDLLSNTLEFPVVKPERTSYEWYAPRGLLKRNWIPKRTALVPALVVVFYDMEWDDPQADEKVIECASRVRSVRAALAGHGTRLAVAVLQPRPRGLPSERPAEAERAHALCVACELQAKALFVLTHGERLLPYVLRLEAAFLDMALAYYHHEAKAIRQHRDRLDKVAHRYLLVRHQFKLGFLGEMRRDTHGALKSYRRAYDDLLEARPADADAHELRTVAGYINYKLCRLLFALNLPRDAIAQHEAHVQRYESRAGPADLLFEHYAWLARQHAAFGELFHEAVRAGLPAVRSHHPGHYYRRAAQYTARRRHAARAALADDPSDDPPGPETPEPVSDYYGQRPWRSPRPGADPPDAGRERAAVRALVRRERRFDHSAMIISFLGSAVSQFKAFHSPRTRRKLVVEMADEYYQSADYSKALTLLAHTLWDYRRERWWTLAAHVTLRALRCAFLAADLQLYLQLCADALDARVPADADNKRRIHDNLLAVLDAKPPDPEPDAPPAEAARAMDAWRDLPLARPELLTLELPAAAGFIKIKPKFSQPKYSVDEEVELQLLVRLLYGSTLRASAATVTVATARASCELAATGASGPDVVLLAGGNEVLLSRYRPVPADAGTRLTVKSVTILIERKRKIYLNFKMDDAADAGTHPELFYLMSSPGDDREFGGVTARTSTQITPRKCRADLTFTDAGPALQGEWFRARLTLANRDPHDLCGFSVSLAVLPAADDAESAPVAELLLDPASAGAASAVLLHDRLPPSGIVTDVFYIKCARTGSVKVRARVVCQSEGVVGVEHAEDFVTEIPVVSPFRLSAEFVDLDLEPTTSVRVDEPFVVVPRIEAASPVELVIEDAALEPADGYAMVDDGHTLSAAAGRRLVTGGAVIDAVCVRAVRMPAPGRLGLYTVRWRRATGGSMVSSCVPLVAPAVSACPVRVRALWPARVVARSALELLVELSAPGPTPKRVRVVAEGSASLLLAGYRSACAWVPGRGTARVRFRVYPVAAGRARPPRLVVSVLGEDGEPQEFREALPGHIMVMPD